MGGWFTRTIVDTNRLPLFCFFAGFIVTFGFIRFSVRMIRAEVKWWPGNVSPGGTHIHHVVFGVIFMIIAGVTGFALNTDNAAANAVFAGLFGLGTALVLDEFSLILHLDDVYWSEKGRTSIDAVFIAIAFTGLLLLGLRPIGVDNFTSTSGAGESTLVTWLVGTIALVLNFGLAGITLIKGKIWTGLIGLFLPILILVGAIRLARPHSPWARWRYQRDKPRAQRKMARAIVRERRLRAPMIAGKNWVQNVIAGRPDSPTTPDGPDVPSS
ncbi:hypothetical protein AB0J82_29790 [Asanoa sp. NPDC049518]|uniref:hypothetical protein n=1 Tax=unclassified Asanoa TaxID=2685164 RepID=UPI00343A437B